MDKTIIKTADIAIEFAQATKLNDIKLVESLLHDNGEFQVQDSKNEIIDANKNEFIKWYKTKLDNTPITDIVYEIGLTPNRSDATCHLGVARDIKAYLQVHKNFKDSVIEPGTQAFHIDNTKSYVPVQVEHPDCIRYCGLTITDIKIAESPEWLKNSLASIGVKSINNIVDITNFILHEYGQPLHAFDYHKIADKKIIVTKVPLGIEFIALDDRLFKLQEDDLVICDGNRYHDYNTKKKPV
jgi:phenylalanyl-tRNA synthetase beta subunit